MNRVGDVVLVRLQEREQGVLDLSGGGPEIRSVARKEYEAVVEEVTGPRRDIGASGTGSLGLRWTGASPDGDERSTIEIDGPYYALCDPRAPRDMKGRVTCYETASVTLVRHAPEPARGWRRWLGPFGGRA